MGHGRQSSPLSRSIDTAVNQSIKRLGVKLVGGHRRFTTEQEGAFCRMRQQVAIHDVTWPRNDLGIAMKKLPTLPGEGLINECTCAVIINFSGP
jgi:hypothetical protein